LRITEYERAIHQRHQQCRDEQAKRTALRKTEIPAEIHSGDNVADPESPQHNRAKTASEFGMHTAFLGQNSHRRKLNVETDHEPPEAAADTAARALHVADAGTGPQTRLARHHAKIPLAADGPFTDRKRAHSGESGAVRRGERPPHTLCFYPGWLRVRLQILCERIGRVETQSRGGGDS